MAFSEEEFQRCKGRLGNLTQAGAKAITAVEGSSDGFHDFMNRSELSQNQGPESRIHCLLSGFSKFTLKKPLAQG